MAPLDIALMISKTLEKLHKIVLTITWALVMAVYWVTINLVGRHSGHALGSSNILMLIMSY